MYFKHIIQDPKHVTYSTRKSIKGIDIQLNEELISNTQTLEFYDRILEHFKNQFIQKGLQYRLFIVLHSAIRNIDNDNIKKFIIANFIENMYQLFYNIDNFKIHIQNLELIDSVNIDNYDTEINTIFTSVTDYTQCTLPENVIKIFNIISNTRAIQSILNNDIELKVVDFQFVEDSEQVSFTYSSASKLINSEYTDVNFVPFSNYAYFRSNLEKFLKSELKRYVVNKENEFLVDIATFTDIQMTDDINSFKQYLLSGNLYHLITNLDDVINNIRSNINTLISQGVVFEQDEYRLTGNCILLISKKINTYINIISQAYTYDKLSNPEYVLDFVLKKLFTFKKYSNIDIDYSLVTKELNNNLPTVSKSIQKFIQLFLGNVHSISISNANLYFSGLVEFNWNLNSLESILMSGRIPIESKESLLAIDLKTALKQYTLTISDQDIIKNTRFLDLTHVKVDPIAKEYSVNDNYIHKNSIKDFFKKLGFSYVENLKGIDSLHLLDECKTIPIQYITQYPNLYKLLKYAKFSQVLNRYYIPVSYILNLNIANIGKYQNSLLSIENVDFIYVFEKRGSFELYSKNSRFFNSTVPASEFFNILSNISRFDYNINILYKSEFVNTFTQLTDYFKFIKNMTYLTALDTTGRDITEYIFSLYSYELFDALVTQKFDKIITLLISQNRDSVLRALRTDFKQTFASKLIQFLEGT